MATATIEAEVLDMERQFWQAIKDMNMDTVSRLSDEPCLLTGPPGVSMIDRKSLVAMMKDATYTLDGFEIKDGAQVRLLGDDVALVGYRASEEMTVDGKPVALDVAAASVWVHRDGRWLCAMHTEAIMGDPFGRDRGT